MKLSQFNFDFPEELLAQHPTRFRDESKMLVLHREDGSLEHKTFKDIVDYFDKDDVFVFNNTKVFPARLYGYKEKTNARIEVFLLRELKPEQLLWDVLVDPARKIRIGNKLFFDEEERVVAEVIDNTTSRGRTLRFLYDGTHEEFKEALFSLGTTPLPRYINRPVEKEDAERYQTIFASEEGAVMAPSAGLHFSRELMKRMEIKDIRFAFLTLHTSLTAYRNIDVDDLTKYKMGSEEMKVTKECCDIVNASRESGHKVVAVGASVLKALETSVSTDGFIKEYDGWTGKFIFPPYEFHIGDAMISNFHRPFSSLLIMSAAFGGYDNVMKAYKEAVQKKYRFGAYGDALLIL